MKNLHALALCLFSTLPQMSCFCQTDEEVNDVQVSAIECPSFTRARSDFIVRVSVDIPKYTQLENSFCDVSIDGASIILDVSGTTERKMAGCYSSYIYSGPSWHSTIECKVPVINSMTYTIRVIDTTSPSTVDGVQCSVFVM